jgi:hypothetical protein
MAKKKRFLTATMADGYVKTIGPTAAPFTHYWRIVAHLGGGDGQEGGARRGGEAARLGRL